MNFTKLENGMYDGFAIIKKIEKKTSARGSSYLDVILADASGEISAKKWDCVDGFEANMVVKVRGDMEIYNGKNQFKITQMRHKNESDDVKMESLIASAPVDGSDLFKMLRSTVEAFADEDFKKIVLSILDKKKEKLTYYPAAFKLHHAMRGGLLYHTASILKMAKAISKIYTNIDRELLLSGVILHDIAKTTELEANDTGIATSYTVQGDLIGHLVRGAIDIELAAIETKADMKKAMLLEHMVVSHHGNPEFGAAVRPMFLEAEILSQLDCLDATIFEINSATSGVEPGSFTDRQWALDNRKLYNHGRTSTEHTVEL